MRKPISIAERKMRQAQRINDMLARGEPRAVNALNAMITRGEVKLTPAQFKIALARGEPAAVEAASRIAVPATPYPQSAPPDTRPVIAKEALPMTARNYYKGPGFVEDFTVYELDFLALAAGATATQSIPIQADSAFKWTKGTYYATIANAAFVDNTRPVPSCTVQILDTGSGRQLFNNAVPVPSIFGTGQLPFILPVERVFQARSSIQVTVVNFDAAVTYNLRLSFVGAKVFEYDKP